MVIICLMTQCAGRMSNDPSLFGMHQIDQERMSAQLPRREEYPTERQKLAMSVEERLRCMYCRRMVYKRDLKLVPQEPGKMRRVARMACPKCIETINEKRKAARKAILKMLKESK